MFSITLLVIPFIVSSTIDLPKTTDELNKQRSPQQVFADVALVVIAGSGTVSIAITNTMHLLLSHHRTLCRLRHELDDVFSDEEIHDQTKLASLPYLNACM